MTKLALLGSTDAEMADSLGIALSTFYVWKKQFAEFADAIKAGKEMANADVAESLYKKAMAGDVTACIFWLKNRRPKEWRDTAQGNGVAFNLVLAGPAAERLTERIAPALGQVIDAEIELT